MEYNNNTTPQNETVLITGASHGIGLELARLFAADGYRMVIVSRDEEQLNRVAVEFKGLGAQDVIIIPKDLSEREGAEELYRETQSQGIHVDILVNDAGVGQHGKFIDNDLGKYLDIIQLNVASLVSLTHLYLQQMRIKNKGRILQLASVASYQPTPLLAVYAASKAFVLSFADALRNELADTGITVTALIPSATDTDFFENAHMEHTKAAQDPEDPKVVAQIGYDCLLKGEPHAYAPSVRGQILMSSMLNNQAVAAQARKQMEPADPPKPADGETK